jgi:general secretion pathway protein H
MNAPRAGYTLLELMVVLAILALAGALAIPAFAAWRPAEPRRAAGGELVRVLELTRERAVAGGAPAELVIDAERARAWLHPRDTSFSLSLPEGCRLLGEARSRMQFSADGPARGAMPLVRCGAGSARVTVDALSGAPHVELLP